ncbi:sensor histidine kinase [Urechidicola croceus]|uniref:histidine kinase n=1 Tax=Urechidicola croceus TaxID=1850246 RepID=A0A1D8P8L8_9FLAO|nr:ATP-binding protein [Urechidicola croceus]AOW20900.1 two-component sensor histidine kinase [Urechidicola croceus]
MNRTKLSLQNRVFLSMVALIIIASILIAIVTIIQYHEQAEEYNTGRLERKETAIRNHITVELNNTTYEIVPSKLRYIFLYQNKIFDISRIHNLEIEIYDLDGNFSISSNRDFTNDTVVRKIDKNILDILANTTDHRYVKREKKDDKEYQSSYTYIVNHNYRPIGILHLPYLEDSSDQDRELSEFLSRLALGFLLIFIVGMVLAYFISSYITRSIKTVSDKMSETRLLKRNEKISLKDASKEIYSLVESYNSMVDDLEESAVKLAQSEREEAWREMAKQVAHEIKNPLTPMRLTVQMFERKFDPEDPMITHKLKEFSKTMIQQIDVMSSIASAFSDFAKMPTQKREKINVVDVVKLATEIFTEPYISFDSEGKNIVANLDKMQITRVVTNLIKNSIQAMVDIDNPSVKVTVLDKGNDVVISVSDNGKGISDELKNKVFEPKFTTKTSGMGLGLPMVKNIIEAYGGVISFISDEDSGTVFTITLPKK